MYCAPGDAEIPSYGKLFELTPYLDAYCLPTVESLEAGADAAASIAAGAGDAVGPATSGAEAALSDIQLVWWTFVVTAFISVVTAMVYLTILRFVIGIIVWGSLA